MLATEHAAYRVHVAMLEASHEGCDTVQGYRGSKKRSPRGGKASKSQLLSLRLHSPRFVRVGVIWPRGSADTDYVCSREADSVESLVPYVLRGVFDENGLDLEFYKEAIKRFDDDEAIPALFTDVMVKISTQLATKSMEDDYKPYVNVSLANDWSNDVY